MNMKFYEAPVVEVIEVEVENGFAASDFTTSGEDVDIVNEGDWY